MSGVPFCPGEVLIPKDHLEEFSVIACDQHTSDLGYWKAVEELVGDYPSALHLMIPEAYLEDIDYDAEVDKIHKTMKQYVRQGEFNIHRNTMVYIERQLKNGKTRHGVLGVINLEDYDYKKGARSLIRASEGTVEERLPARVQVRRGAWLEMPHVMLLIDDPTCTVIESLAEVKDQREKLYDFDLNMGGGHIAGYKLKGPDYMKVMQACDNMADMQVFSEKYGTVGKMPMVFAVGDGNHSLAAAKKYLEERQEEGFVDRANPLFYALVEVCNIHDPSLEFEAIHRVVYGVNPEHFAAALEDYCSKLKGDQPPQTFTVLYGDVEETVTVLAPEHTIAVGTVQNFLDAYLAEHGGKVDYIHGEDVTRKLSAEGAVGILLPAMKKEELFPTIIHDGALPRKTFSMGESSDKRYYLECRKLV